MARVSCVDCYDGMKNHCDECNIYKLLQAVQNLSRDELEHLIDIIESSEREALDIDDLVRLKFPYMLPDEENKSTKFDGITW